MPSIRRARHPLARLLAILLLAASLVAQVAGALLPHVPLLILSVVVGLATEGVLYRWQRAVVAALAKVRADVTLRQVLRDLLLVSALLRLDAPAHSTRYLPLVYGLLLFYGLHVASHAAAILVRRSRTLPVVTRNVDTAVLRLTPAPPALLLRRPGHRVLLFGLPATLGLLLSAGIGVPVCAAVGVALSIGCATAGLGELLLRLLPGRRPPGEEEVLEWFDAWLAEYRPTVGMYFSGGASSAYQANMWLEPLAGLHGRPMIVLRERFMMQKIAATDIPMVCVPKVAHLMRLEHSTLRVLIHPANSGKTSQILRIPTIKHAFVNHGESDKLSSCNPYAKAYDEVWVAGAAARARYRLADVGVDDRDVVEIGRPQLDAIRPYEGPPTGPYLTVLYAPTWEGWDGNPGNTSVILAGENVVRTLLADPGVRLLYKPHPMTGSVDPRAGAANERIQAMIRGANATRTAREAPAAGRRGDAERARAAAELARRAAEVDRVTTSAFRGAADDAERMSVQGTPEQGRAAAVSAATAAWEDAYWAALPAGAHQVITSSRPALYSCFNRADLLIGDVSSVISDYLASGKPYAVANTSGLTEDAFRAAFVTVRAATVLTPDASGLPQLLHSVREPDHPVDAGGDGLAAARAALKLRLLGPSEPPSMVRFAAAVRALGQEALAQRTRTASTVPGQAGAREPVAGDASRGLPGDTSHTLPVGGTPLAGTSRQRGRSPQPAAQEPAEIPGQQVSTPAPQNAQTAAQDARTPTQDP